MEMKAGQCQRATHTEAEIKYVLGERRGERCGLEGGAKWNSILARTHTKQ